MNKKNLIRLVATLVVGGILIAVLLKFIDVGQVVEYLKHVKVAWVIASLACYILTYFVRGARWRKILEPIQKTTLKEIFLAYWSGLLINFIIPVRAGELAKSYILKKTHQTPISKSIATVFVDKIADFIPIVLLFALVPFLPQTTKAVQILLWSLMAIFLLMIAFLFFSVFRQNSVVKFLRAFFFYLPKKWLDKISGVLNKFVSAIHVIKSFSMIKAVIFYTLLSLILDTLYVVFMFKAFGFNINYLTALFGYTLFNLSFIFPTPPAQVGTTEAIQIVIFTIMFGIEKNLVAATMGFAHLATGIVNVAIGTISLMTLNIKMSNLLSKGDASEETT